jgi:pyruvate/2-oxoglutarate dehydrogenase complex dihydrolipoamide acyltransferase (E2) component
MPQTGVSVSEGTIVRWRKRPGDTVVADEILVEISTDKIDTDVPSPSTGRLGAILVEEGATVAVGTVLARIESPRGDGPDPGGGADVAEGAPREGEADAAEAPGEGAAPLSPVVQRLAAEHGIELGLIAGSGRGGRVTKRDVLAHVESAAARLERSRSAGAAPAPVAAGVGTPPPPSVPLSPMRRQIAEHMVRSLRTAAHCTTIVEVDMSGVEAAAGRSYLSCVAHAVVGALGEHPRLNATLEDDRLTIHPAVHLGVAVSLGEDGLIVPVVRDAHALSAEQIGERVADLAARARGRLLTPDEVRGGTFTLTNPGRHGALLATPIINQPQVAILDLEAVVRRPVVVGGDAIAIRPMAYLCMSWDHRALDGELAARFLGSVRRRLEALGVPDEAS